MSMKGLYLAAAVTVAFTGAAQAETQCGCDNPRYRSIIDRGNARTAQSSFESALNRGPGLKVKPGDVCTIQTPSGIQQTIVSENRTATGWKLVDMIEWDGCQRPK